MRRLSTVPRSGWLIAAACAVAVLVAAGLWLRDSPLVEVSDVAITGASGPDAPKIEAALRSAAREMTTLNVHEDELRDAVAAFPTVGDLEVRRDFPHGLRIEVVEREPVAVVGEGDDRMPVTAGGDVLRGATAPDDLPLIDDSRDERVLELLATAPRPLLRRAERAFNGERGLTVRMAEGPTLYFGTATELAAKWAAAARVLADPTAEGATYVDVRVPERTAAGGLAPVADEEDEAEPGVTGATPATAAAPPAATPVQPATAATTTPATDPAATAANPGAAAPAGAAGAAVAP
ncbi:MAG TPA: FtsQ-type POTRA domain-containing protein [Solirubrobacteraceae bacterium]|nr:FtsQ-type POTRA domain-containing protein [Solirubrobacteraceae bacterium]